MIIRTTTTSASESYLTRAPPSRHCAVETRRPRPAVQTRRSRGIQRIFAKPHHWLMLATTIAVILCGPAPVVADALASPTPNSSLRLISVPAIATEGTPFQVEVAITSPAAISKISVSFEFGAPVQSRSAFLKAISDETTSTPLQTIAADTVSANGDGSARARIAPTVLSSGEADNSTVVLSKPGVYPLRITLDTGDEPMPSITTFVIQPPAEIANPLAFAWIWPIYEPPPNSPNDPPDGLTASAGASGRLGRIASAAQGSPIPLSPYVVPETLAALGSLAESNNPIKATYNALISAGARHRIVDVPYAEVTADAWRVANSEAAAQFLAARSTLGVFGKQSPIGVQLPSGSQVSISSLQFLRDSFGARNLVLASGALAPPQMATTLKRPFRIGGVDGVRGAIIDPILGEDFEADGGPVLAAQQLIADLFVLYNDSPGNVSGVISMPVTTWAPSASLLAETLSRLTSATFVKPVDIGTFFDVVPDQGSGRSVFNLENPDATPSNSADGQYQSVIAARRDFASFTPMLTTPQDFSSLDRELLTSLDQGLIAAKEAVNYSASVTSSIETVLSSVQASRGQSIHITSRKARIPISIINTSDFSVRVRIQLESSRLRFPELMNSSQDVVVIDPKNSVTLETLVDTPSSGSFPLRVIVSSPDGSLLIDETTIQVESSAVNGVAIVLSVGSLAFLGIWWFASALRRRRSGKHVFSMGRRGTGPDVIESRRIELEDADPMVRSTRLALDERIRGNSHERRQ